MKKPKDFNISYNLNYNITFSPHFVRRWKTREIDIDKVEETVKTGRVIGSHRSKLVLERYFGKENETYIVVVVTEEGFTEVRTTWKRKGR